MLYENLERETQFKIADSAIRIMKDLPENLAGQIHANREELFETICRIITPHIYKKEFLISTEIVVELLINPYLPSELEIDKFYRSIPEDLIGRTLKEKISVANEFLYLFAAGKCSSKNLFQELIIEKIIYPKIILQNIEFEQFSIALTKSNYFKRFKSSIHNICYKLYKKDFKFSESQRKNITLAFSILVENQSERPKSDTHLSKYFSKKHNRENEIRETGIGKVKRKSRRFMSFVRNLNGSKISDLPNHFYPYFNES